jgi:hypothetical protein
MLRVSCLRRLLPSAFHAARLMPAAFHAARFMPLAFHAARFMLCVSCFAFEKFNAFGV